MNPNQIDTCFGFPIIVDLRSTDFVAEARGVWPWQIIVVTRAFLGLPHYEQQAVLAHEAQHNRGHHFALRLLMIPLCWTSLIKRVARQQELDCDAFAASHGLGVYMLRVIARFQAHEQSEFYPSYRERVAHLQQRNRGFVHEAAT